MKKQSKKQLKAQKEAELEKLGLFISVPKTTTENFEAIKFDENNALPIIEPEQITEGKLLEDTIEEMRKNLGTNLTPVTPQSFAEWNLKRKKAKEEKNLKKKIKREKDIASGKVSMTGRELYEKKQSLFIDDVKADQEIYKKEEDLIVSLEQQMRLDAESRGEEFDFQQFKQKKDEILKNKEKTHIDIITSIQNLPIDESLFNEEDLPDEEE